MFLLLPHVHIHMKGYDFLKTIALAVLSAVFIALVIADSMRKVKENKEHSKD